MYILKKEAETGKFNLRNLIDLPSFCKRVNYLSSVTFLKRNGDLFISFPKADVVQESHSSPSPTARLVWRITAMVRLAML